MKKYFYLLCAAIACATVLLGILIFQHEQTKKDLKRVIKQEVAYSRTEDGPVTLVQKKSTYIAYPSDDQGKVLGGLDKELGQLAKKAKGGDYRFIGVTLSQPNASGIRQATFYQHSYIKGLSSLKKAKKTVLKKALVKPDYQLARLTDFLSRSTDLKSELRGQVETGLNRTKLSQKKRQQLLAHYDKLDLSKLDFSYSPGKLSFKIDGQKLTLAIGGLYGLLNPEYLQGRDLTQYQAYKRGDGKTTKMSGRVVALTFDDGPDATTTPQVLEILARYQAKATFFVVGRNVAGNEQILKDTLAAGHEIGNHSWSHAQLNKLTPDTVTAELDQTSQAIAQACGKMPTTFRPPYGATNETVNSLTALYPVLWDVDTLDWKNRNTASILSQVQAQVSDGSVILMHDIHQTTVDALPAVLDYLTSQGYQFVTVSQLYGYI